MNYRNAPHDTKVFEEIAGYRKVGLMKIIESGIKNVDAHESVKVVMPSNLYGCELAENVFVGPFVEIQKEVKIGARTKVQVTCFHL